MYYIGLDVHKKTISYCVKDASGKVHRDGKIGVTRQELDSWMKTLLAAVRTRATPVIRFFWLHIAGFLSAATDGRDDRNLGSGGDGTHKPTGIANIFVSYKDIDVFPNLSLLGGNPISNARVEYPQRRQPVRQRGGRAFYFNFAEPISEFAQGARNVKSHRHNQPFFVGRDLRVVADFVGDEIACDSLDDFVPDSREASSTTAVRMQTTDGSPSRILCHVLPSSREPKICPLRVPK
jgi:hypothetical protein